MSIRTKRGLRLDKYIGEGELGIDDSQFSIFHTNNDELEGQPIYNRFASVDHMKAVPPPLTGNYMPPSNIPNIDESQMVYGKKATNSFEIKTTDDSITHNNDSVLFDFSDRSLEPSTNDLKMCDSSVECSRPNHSDHDSTSSVFAPASESRDTIVIANDKQEDFPSVCSIETHVKSSKPLCNKFGSFNKESHFRKHKSVVSKSCYVCGSYLHLIKDCDFHEQTFAKRNAEGKGILGRRPIGKPVNPNRHKPVLLVNKIQFLLVCQTRFLLDSKTQFLLVSQTQFLLDSKTQFLLVRQTQFILIFKYLTAYPKLGLWYPRDSPFDLEAFFDSDYAGAHGDRKSTTGGCQFLGRRIISCQCKKQIIVATSFCEAEYMADASCCGQRFLLLATNSAGWDGFYWWTFIFAVTWFLLVIYYFCWLYTIPAVTYVSAASFVPAGTPIAAGVSTTAGASGSASEATVPIIELLDSPLKDTSIPLDPKTEEQDVPLRKSSRKKSIARRRTLLSPSKSKSAALPFDEDDPEAEFKKYLRQGTYHWAGRADLMVLYGMVSDKYKIERATSIGLGLWSDLRMLITAREDRDASIIWDDQDQWAIRSWRFYALPAIHVLETKAGDIIYTFVDKKWFQIACSSKIQQSQTKGIQRCSWCFKFHIQDPNFAVDTSCCSTLNPHTALMTIYYWKLDNKQVTIQFRGGLLGIVIPTAIVFCSCWKVFISAGVLFLLVVLHCCC
nr:putative ribonuclease H-like domain-containing protein [Tanacetum cinerariifolium]